LTTTEAASRKVRRLSTNSVAWFATSVPGVVLTAARASVVVVRPVRGCVVERD
jgi:hypothetical protein